jgi:glycosyltransferase involved in cell wall biosynthesis
VDPETFRPDTPPADLSAYRGSGRKIAGYMGTMTAWHGIDLFFDAARILRDENHPVLILAVGGDPDRVDRLRLKTAELGLESHLQFHGSIPYDQVPGYLAAMDVCLIPDAQDWSSPTKYFEFAASGRPVVAARLPATEEVLGLTGETGLFFERRNARDMVTRILQVLGDPELAARLGRGARTRILQYFTWDCNLRAMMALFQKLGVRAATLAHGLPASGVEPSPADRQASLA